MATIYKYKLDLKDGEQEINLPSPYTILQVGNQAEELVVWAQIDPDGVPSKAVFRVFHTGQGLPEDICDYDHKGSVMFIGGSFVVHVFCRYW